MRKTLVILLMSIYLLGNTEAGQLLRLPRLLAHFFHHHQQDSSISFLDFILMHYAGDDGTTADDDQDKQLPCHNAIHNTITIAFSTMVKDIPLFDFSNWETKMYVSHLPSELSSEYAPLILQPPRVV